MINNLIVTDNIFFAKEASQLTLRGRLRPGSSYANLGSFNNNYYARPISEPLTLKAFVNAWDGAGFSLSTWKTMIGQEVNSKNSPISITDISDLKFVYNETGTNKVIPLSMTYIDVKGTSYNGSITLLPYTSAVLIKSKNQSPAPNSSPSIKNQSFLINQSSVNGTEVGTVVASDPDPGQTLTYSILSGNNDGTFAINSFTGLITVAKANNLDNSNAAGGSNNYTIFESTTPPGSSTYIYGNGSQPFEVGIKFTSNVDGTITGFRYYKGDGMQGTHIGNLWNINGTKLASAVFTNETASGWQTVTLNIPVIIKANTIYVISYFSQNGDFVFSRNYFTNNIVNGPITAIASTSGQSNGVYKQTASSAFPTQSNLESNYWADIVFSPATSVSTSIFQSTTPPNSSTYIYGNGSQPFEVGMKFRSNTDGFITGFRYYKATGTKGIHTGNLWSIDGTRLASAVFTNETASGWQTITLNNPVALKANTIYVVSYFSQNGDFIFSRNYFTSNIVNGSLTAIASTSGQSNGVYKQTASSAFPTLSNLESNYWVDVLFSSTLTSTPAPPSSFALGVNVQDNGTGNLSSQATITININATKSVNALKITSNPSDTAIVGNSYSYEAIYSLVEEKPIKLSVMDLPNWLHFVDNGNGKGTFTGTPVLGDIGSYKITLVEGNDIQEAQQFFTIHVKPNLISEAQNHNNFNVQIYPNPVTDGKLNIKLDGEIPEQLQVSIFEMSGKLLFKNNYDNSNMISLNMSDYPAGIYLIEFRSAKSRFTDKFIIK